MPTTPLRFEFFLADRDHPVGRKDPLTATPLPLARTVSEPPPPRGESGRVTYGDFFHAIRDFIQKDPSATLYRACSDLLQEPLAPAKIERVDVFLSKHGAFYHPCRIVARVGNRPVEMALNGAVSESGRQVIDREYRHLRRLGSEFPFDFVPRVYASGNGCDGKNRPIRMFLGEWFSGFCECHLSRDPSAGTDRIRVWGDGDEGRYLTASETREFYSRCARILTSYYNPLTFEQIFPWHHAAGDFILAIRPRGIDVRLVTVRNYQPLLTAPEAGHPQEDRKEAEGRILDGLLVFFLALSLRMRLDRRDGVGEIIWAPNEAVAGAVSGFFQGLSSICERYGFPQALAEVVRRYLLAHSPDQLEDLCRNIAGTYSPDSEEQRAIRRHSSAHAETLRRVVEAG